MEGWVMQKGGGCRRVGVKGGGTWGQTKGFNNLFISPPALFSYSFVVCAWQAPSMHLAF